MIRIPRLAGFFAAASLSLAFASCSGPGGNALTTAPTASPSPTPGAITFAGANVSGNTISIVCPPSNSSTFTISQSNYSGSFTLVSNSGEITVSPSSGTSATSFTVADPDNYATVSTTLTVTGGGGVIATPAVTASSGCG